MSISKVTIKKSSKSETPAAPKRAKGGAKAVAASAVLVGVAPGATPPVSAVVPVPPANWVNKPVGRGRGILVPTMQASVAGSVATELESSTTFTADFGPHAPSPTQIAALLQGASAWRTQLIAAKSWEAYANTQDGAWWQAALALVNSFEGAFNYAAARDSSIAERYPALAKFMTARTAVAMRAAKTRKAAVAKARKAEATSGAVSSSQALQANGASATTLAAAPK